jgi:hypothetical protein
VKKLVFAFSLLAVSAFAAEIKGTISDAKCGAGHAAGDAKAQKCVNACVKGGQKAVLVTSDGKILQIADQEKVAAHLGHKVTITGKVDGETVSVDKVSMD